MNTIIASLGNAPDGARLSHVAGSPEGPAHWEVKVMREGNPLRRRFVAERGARVWLSLWRRDERIFHRADGLR